MEDLYIDNLSGNEFEEYLLNLFKNLGYDGRLTPTSNDFGADLIVSKDDEKVVVQAKRYSNTVGISSVQEVIGARNYYQANKCLVVTSNYFTPNAIDLAEANNVELWDRDVLIKMITLSLDVTGNSKNHSQNLVPLQDILNSSEYNNISSDIPLILGRDSSGKPIVATIDEMPHLLIAGSTGTGKSICIHTLIAGILHKSTSNNVKFLLIDPKLVELNIYNGIPHLLIPVVTDARKATFALSWTVEEMEKRYKLFAQNNVRDIISYNNKYKNEEIEKLPKIIIIIDELADLITPSTREIEDYIYRLTQRARAVGIYLIATTQMPATASTFKNNFPSRISFRVFSQADSKKILDVAGAEKLLGKGDMLFYPIGESRPIRVKGAFISEEEINQSVDHLKEMNISKYDKDIMDVMQPSKEIPLDDSDELLPEAINLVVEEEQASISLLQRKLKIGYARAARIIDEMEERGVIGGYEGSAPRKVLISKDEFDSIFKGNDYLHRVKERSKINYEIKPHKTRKKGKFFRITLSFFILIIVANLTIVKIDNPAVGFPVLFLITFISFKLGSFITDKLFKNN